MMYLVESDFESQIKLDILDKITQNNASIVYDAERKTIAEMDAYLRTRYDVVQVWNKSGEDRNALLVMYGVDIFLYHIHSRLNPRQIPDIRGIRYDAAIAFLKDVAKSVLSLDLPYYTGEQEKQNVNFRYGSEKRRNLNY